MNPSRYKTDKCLKKFVMYTQVKVSAADITPRNWCTTTSLACSKIGLAGGRAAIDKGSIQYQYFARDKTTNLCCPRLNLTNYLGNG